MIRADVLLNAYWNMKRWYGAKIPKRQRKRKTRRRRTACGESGKSSLSGIGILHRMMMMMAEKAAPILEEIPDDKNVECQDDGHDNGMAGAYRLGIIVDQFIDFDRDKKS